VAFAFKCFAAGLGDDAFEVAAGLALGLVGNPLQHVFVDVEFARAFVQLDFEDVQPVLQSGQVNLDQGVEAAGPLECGIQVLDAVGRGQDDDVVALDEAVHLREQLIQGGRPLLVLRGAAAPDGVQLVDEDDAGREFAGFIEHLAYAFGADSDLHFDELRAALLEKVDVGLACGCLGQRSLARASRAMHQDAFADQVAVGLELRLLELVHDVGQLLLRLVVADDVLEKHVGFLDAGLLDLLLLTLDLLVHVDRQLGGEAHNHVGQDQVEHGRAGDLVGRNQRRFKVAVGVLGGNVVQVDRVAAVDERVFGLEDLVRQAGLEGDGAAELDRNLLDLVVVELLHELAELGRIVVLGPLLGQ